MSSVMIFYTDNAKLNSLVRVNSICIDSLKVLTSSSNYRLPCSKFVDFYNMIAHKN